MIEVSISERVPAFIKRKKFGFAIYKTGWYINQTIKRKLFKYGLYFLKPNHAVSSGEFENSNGFQVWRIGLKINRSQPRLHFYVDLSSDHATTMADMKWEL